MNISMVSGLMPVVGIPLPLISYGGSAMLAIMISIGLVLNAELNSNVKKINNEFVTETLITHKSQNLIKKIEKSIKSE